MHDLKLRVFPQRHDAIEDHVEASPRTNDITLLRRRGERRKRPAGPRAKTALCHASRAEGAHSYRSLQGGEGVLAGALQSEREEETRDRAERGSAVRGSDQASVAPERTPSPTPYRGANRSARQPSAKMCRRRRRFCATIQRDEIGRARLHRGDNERYVLVEIDTELVRAVHHVFAADARAKALSFIFLRTDLASTSWTLLVGRTRAVAVIRPVSSSTRESLRHLRFARRVRVLRVAEDRLQKVLG